MFIITLKIQLFSSKLAKFINLSIAIKNRIDMHIYLRISERYVLGYDIYKEFIG